jgi:hypothetical protein
VIMAMAVYTVMEGDEQPLPLFFDVLEIPLRLNHIQFTTTSPLNPASISFRLNTLIMIVEH